MSCQKSNPFVCVQISGIATGQTLQLTKRREIIAIFFFFFNPNRVDVLAKQFLKNVMTLFIGSLIAN